MFHNYVVPYDISLEPLRYRLYSHLKSPRLGNSKEISYVIPNLESESDLVPVRVFP